MNILQGWRLVLSDGPVPNDRIDASAPTSKINNTGHLPVANADVPSVMTMMLGYIIPLALITPIMLNIVVSQYPKLFTDLLPGQRLYIVTFALFIMQVVAVPLLALIVKHLSSMVSLLPSYKESLLVTAVSATPFSLVSLFYLVPSFAFNIVMHAIAGLLATLLVYLGVKNVFGLQRRGARTMLTIAIVATASLAFGVLLVSTLMLWGQVQQLQWAVHASR